MNGKNAITTRVKNGGRQLARLFVGKPKKTAKETPLSSSLSTPLGNSLSRKNIDEEISPEVYIDNAENIAEKSFTIVKQNSYVIDFGRNKSKERYISISGWQALALAHGCTVSSTDVSADYDNNGKLMGYKAKGYVKRMKDNAILTEAEGYAGMTEASRTWGKHTFSRRSMAQTRAMSRACRAAFAHITGLLNEIETKENPERKKPPIPFSNTPYEEMLQKESSKKAPKTTNQEAVSLSPFFLSDDEKVEMKQAVAKYEKAFPQGDLAEGDLAEQMRVAYKQQDKEKVLSLLKAVKEKVLPASSLAGNSDFNDDFSEIIAMTDQYKLYYGEDEQTKQIAEGIAKNDLRHCGLVVSKMRDKIEEYKRNRAVQANDEVPI